MKRVVSLVVLIVSGVVIYEQYGQVPPPPVLRQTVSGSEAGNHYSPAENLERLDIEQLDRARHTVDIAMYSFTDKFLADELLRLAHRGVQVRIYRDLSQYQEEQHLADQHRNRSLMDLFLHHPSIHIRVKNGGERDLMHLKAYLVDSQFLRDGSANWSPAGLKRQDNNVHFTTDANQVQAFQQTFERMWSRSDNRQLQ